MDKILSLADSAHSHVERADEEGRSIDVSDKE
jgi:hypothetical protein